MEIFVYQGAGRELVGIVSIYSNFRALWRYDEPGEFTLRIPANGIKGLTIYDIRPGLWLWPQGARGIFIVETAVFTSSEGLEVIELSGRDASALLARRVFPDSDYADGNQGDLIYAMLSVVFQDYNRQFPGLTLDIDRTLGHLVKYQPETTVLLDNVQTLCKSDSLGFETVFDPVGRGLTFRVFKGVDRTGVGGVIFDPEYENIADIEYVDSIEDYANVTYIVGGTSAEQSDGVWVWKPTKDYVDPGFDETGEYTAGYDRFETITNYTQESMPDDPGTSVAYRHFVPGPDSVRVYKFCRSYMTNLVPVDLPLPANVYDMSMEDAGRADLADKAHKRELTGAIQTRVSTYRFREDYNLGDVVTIRYKRWGIEQNQRIKAVEENWDDGVYSAIISIGDPRPTLLKRIKRSAKLPDGGAAASRGA